MSEAVKAKRADIILGSRVIDGFMLPDGSYRMSQEQSASAIGLKPQNASDFLRSKALKNLVAKGYTDQIFQIEIDSSEQVRGQSRFNALPLEVVCAYWSWQSYRGNKEALNLCFALMAETLERRFDRAFGVELTEEERDQRLQMRVEQLELDLGNAYAIADDVIRERDLFAQVLKDSGIDPYALSSDEEQ